MVNIEVNKISYHPPSKGYAVLLQETGGTRQLPIVVGSNEAQAIALALEGIQMPRPLTHDLISELVESFNAKISKIIINKLVKGTFFAQIFIKTINNNEIKIDSRPSDAIAIALKTLAPIFVIEKVIESATLKSIVIENGISTPPAGKDSKISKFETLDNLKDALNKAIKDEEYEIAAKLRDKITNIEGNS